MLFKWKYKTLAILKTWTLQSGLFFWSSVISKKISGVPFSGIDLKIIGVEVLNSLSLQIYKRGLSEGSGLLYETCVWMCVCVLLQMFLGNKPSVHGKVNENMLILVSLCFSHIGRPLFSLLTTPITCFSGPWCPPIYGTPLRLWTAGEVAGGVCTACFIPEKCVAFTQAAQLLRFFFFLNVH